MMYVCMYYSEYMMRALRSNATITHCSFCLPKERVRLSMSHELQHSMSSYTVHNIIFTPKTGNASFHDARQGKVSPAQPMYAFGIHILK